MIYVCTGVWYFFTKSPLLYTSKGAMNLILFILMWLFLKAVKKSDRIQCFIQIKVQYWLHFPCKFERKRNAKFETFSLTCSCTTWDTHSTTLSGPATCSWWRNRDVYQKQIKKNYRKLILASRPVFLLKSFQFVIQNSKAAFIHCKSMNFF